MATSPHHETPADAELIGSRIGRIDPDIFRDQNDPTDNKELDNEPSGKDDHQQDDNYAAGEHITRSGGTQTLNQSNT